MTDSLEMQVDYSSRSSDVHRLFWVFETNGRTIHVPKSEGILYERTLRKIEIGEATKLAQSYANLITAVVGCFGSKQVSFNGPIAGQDTYSRAKSVFSFHSIDIATQELRHSLNEQGTISEQGLYRLRRREDNPSLFNIEASLGTATLFANKTSPLRNGAKAISDELVARFDKHVESYTGKLTDSDNIAVEELINILAETRKYAIAKLKSVKAEVTDENVTELLKFLHTKSYRVVKETMTAMPFLKVDRELDKNLARMVGDGLTYERILVFNISESYPTNRENMEDMVALPHSWMIRAIG